MRLALCQDFDEVIFRDVVMNFVLMPFSIC